MMQNGSIWQHFLKKMDIFPGRKDDPTEEFRTTDQQEIYTDQQETRMD